MLYRSGVRPRYPKKRRIPRVILLPGLLVLCVMIALAVVRLAPAGGERAQGASKKNAARAGGPTELDASEAYPQGPLPATLRFDKLLLEKSRRRLTAFAQGKAVRVYLAALGEKPVGHKEYEGDKRTPEGRYRIDDKNAHSAYHKNLGISYPNAQDRARAAAAGKNPGGNIKIHGLAPSFAHLGQAHRLTDWTYGCIAVTNPEIEELFARTEIGTPVEIVP
ncbi:MAG: L,D-transpeptidase family protein [Desulfovibrio sp.]|nr:L,D-transpeptidase family protein [Desulfovibrio sp.]